MTDDQGRRYLDGTASLWYVNVGHGRARSWSRRSRRSSHAGTYPSSAPSRPPAHALAERLSDLAPVDDAGHLPRHRRRRLDRHRGQARPPATGPRKASRSASTSSRAAAATTARTDSAPAWPASPRTGGVRPARLRRRGDPARLGRRARRGDRTAGARAHPAAFLFEPVIASGGVLRRRRLLEDVASCAATRHPADRRRGDLRLRPARRLVWARA